MADIDEKTAAFRQGYRAVHIRPGYRGWAHFAFTAGLSSAIIVWCLLSLDAVRVLEWLTVPLSFLYSNLTEYLGHRGPMHHPRRGLRAVYERHTLQHHRFFTAEDMAFENSHDFYAVLFPPVLVVFFAAAFTLPAALLLGLLLSANVAYLFVATTLGYFLNYELLHFAYHLPEDSAVQRLPFMARLRRLHLDHHRPELMSRYNFNITYPIGDALFGTLYRGSK